MTYDIYFFEVFKEEKELLKRYLPVKISSGFFHETIQESGIKEPPAKIISIRTHSVIPKSWLNKISAIISRTTAYDHVKKYSKDIPCGHLPEYCTRAVAEQIIMLCLSLSRKLSKQIKQFHDFKRDGLTGFEIKGKNMLIVGVGKIGHEVYKIAKGLGMKVFGVDIIKRHEDVEYIERDDGLKNADVIVCSMNLTKDNTNYFNYETLKKTKPGVIFINTAKGEHTNSKDLLKLINESHIGSLALDVYNKELLLGKSLRGNKNCEDIDKEEIKATLELSKKDNVIFTPHNSFNTKEATERKASQTVEQLKHFFDNGNFLWKVPE